MASGFQAFDFVKESYRRQLSSYRLSMQPCSWRNYVKGSPYSNLELDSVFVSNRKVKKMYNGRSTTNPLATISPSKPLAIGRCVVWALGSMSWAKIRYIICQNWSISFWCINDPTTTMSWPYSVQKISTWVGLIGISTAGKAPTGLCIPIYAASNSADNWKEISHTVMSQIDASISTTSSNATQNS